MNTPENNHTPKLRFSEFSDNWEVKKLGEVVSKIGSGSTPFGGSTVYEEKGIIFIRSQNVNNEKLELNDVVYIKEEIHHKMKGSTVIQNDILLNITGASLGRSCVVPANFTTGNVNQHVCIIRLTKEYYSTFLQPFLSSERGQKLMLDGQTGGGREGLNFQNIRAFPIAFPTFPEQTKIGNFLTTVDTKIQGLRKEKALLEQYKKGMMQRIFSQTLRFKDADNQDFPNWEVKKGNDIFANISDKKHNSDLPILAITQEHGAIPRDLIDYSVIVTEKSVESYKVVQIDDFIISLRSFQGGIEHSKYKGICSPAYIILRSIIPINNLFYKFYFKTESYIVELNKNLEGIRDGKMISYKYFSEIDLPYPTLPEQTKIANFLSAIDKKISNCAERLEKMEVWKKGLLQQMFV